MKTKLKHLVYVITGNRSEFEEFLQNLDPLALTRYSFINLTPSTRCPKGSGLYTVYGSWQSMAAKISCPAQTLTFVSANVLLANNSI